MHSYQFQAADGDIPTSLPCFQAVSCFSCATPWPCSEQSTIASCAKGIVQVDGQSVHDTQVPRCRLTTQAGRNERELHDRFFIDTNILRCHDAGGLCILKHAFTRSGIPTTRRGSNILSGPLPSAKQRRSKDAGGYSVESDQLNGRLAGLSAFALIQRLVRNVT